MRKLGYTCGKYLLSAKEYNQDNQVLSRKIHYICEQIILLTSSGFNQLFLSLLRIFLAGIAGFAGSCQEILRTGLYYCHGV
jgi:hypothetical protein